ncbi:unnamed protein product [Lupinus luteus]|uniref:Pectinesterase n=1 Tax=Lupinus luteus TaxID=3873 RepID=A0AAV1WT63_LUPLU
MASYTSLEFSIIGKIFLELLFLSLVLPIASSIRTTSSNNNIDWWCNQTPHPESCKYYISQTTYHEIKQKSLFRVILVQLALKQVLIMQSETRDFEKNLMSKMHKALHDDCLELYDNSIFHLNSTIKCMHNKRSCSPFDAQTWLSTAHTNIQTCPTAASELNAVDFKVSELSNNVTEIISNSLAINMDFLKQNENIPPIAEGGTEVFPSWVSSSDRELLTSSSSSIKADLVVAKDGSGQFDNIQAAIDKAASIKSNKRFIIHVKEGTYVENIKVDLKNEKIMLIGDGTTQTIITGSKNAQDGFSIYDSPTAVIDAPYFIASLITFENTAGPTKMQAVALRSASDFSVFYRCSFVAYQDTLYIQAQRQFFTECNIYGTVDFIFGDAAAVIQNSNIYARKPLQGQSNMITAQGRDQPNKNTGISIQNCKIRAAPDLEPLVGQVKTFLGRPWKQYARVAVINTFVDTLVDPLGWSPWNNSNFALDTLYYGEYQNSGPASSTSNRVKWPTFHVLNSSSEVFPFTIDGLLSNGNTNVPISTGL